MLIRYTLFAVHPCQLEGYHASRSFAVKLLQRQPSMKALENPGDIEHVLDVFGNGTTPHGLLGLHRRPHIVVILYCRLACDRRSSLC